jgi:hypothetical protein
VTKIVPPFCFLLGLFNFIAGFALMAIEPPQPSMDLHRARVEGDDQYRDLLEDQLERRQLLRKVLIVTLFTCSVLFPAVGFMAMQPTGPPRHAGGRGSGANGRNH